MKTAKIIILIGFLLFNKIGAQSMQLEIKETILKLFIYTDEKKWDNLQKEFAEKVLLDYSSFTGNEASEVTPKQISDSWSSFLPLFNSTHHQISNFLIEQSGNRATVYCYGTATHYFPNKSGNDIWTVVGTYDFDLEKIDSDWKVKTMKFNFKYQAGNTDLPKLVQEKIGVQNAK